MRPTAIRRGHIRAPSSNTSPGRIALLVGIVGALSALIGSVAPTAVAWKATASSSAANEKALDVTQKGQAADRFTAAIDQIGSDRLSVRLGGIYALDRIAKDDASYYYPVKSILAALVRTSVEVDGKPSADVIAALDFILPRLPYKETTADLTGARISGVELRDRNANGVILRRARLENVSFRGSFLVSAHLEEATLSGSLEGATLVSAFLCGADLSNALIISSDIDGHRRTNLRGAIMDAKTKLPLGTDTIQLGITRGNCNS